MKKFFLLFLAIISVYLLQLSSCKNEDQGKPSGDDCATLSRSKIKKNWSDPKNIDYLVFFTNYHRISKDFKVSVQAFNSKYEPVGKLINLNMGSFDICTKGLGPVAISENIVELENLKIYDDKWNLIDFSHLNLKPMTKNGYLIYDLTVMKDKALIYKAPDPTLPCPPCYNCKPLPEGCTLPKSTTTDTSQVTTDTLEQKK